MKHEFRFFHLDSPLAARTRIQPEAASRNTALFFVHGGGWCAGSRTAYHAIMEHCCGLGYLCASTDYRPPARSVSRTSKAGRHSTSCGTFVNPTTASSPV